MASRASSPIGMVILHLGFAAVVASISVALALTDSLPQTGLRWAIAYAPFWIWLVFAMRRSPLGIRIALLCWTFVTVLATVLSEPITDLTVVPKVVWVMAEAGLAFYFLRSWLAGRSRAGVATACEIASDVALVVAITSGVTWVFARGAYEASLRLLESGELLRIVNGSVGALVGVAVSVALVRAWFRSTGRAGVQDPALLLG